VSTYNVQGSEFEFDSQEEDFGARKNQNTTVTSTVEASGDGQGM
jgi:hypothetical protein